jgi:hypothetical protein
VLLLFVVPLWQLFHADDPESFEKEYVWTGNDIYSCFDENKMKV